MDFSRQEYWSGLSFPTTVDFPNPGIKPTSPISPVRVNIFSNITVEWKEIVPKGYIILYTLIYGFINMKYKDMHGKHTQSSGKWLVLGGGERKEKTVVSGFF